MSQRYKGAIISATPPTTSTSSATGEWTLAQQMQAQGGGNWPIANPDPYFNQVSLLLHGDGTNGGQNNTFLDSSTNNFTITRNGNTTQGTFTPFSQAAGYWSNYFNGSTDYLTVPPGSAFAYGTGDFTVEGWFYATAPLPQYGSVILAQTTSGTNYFKCTLGDDTISPTNKVSFTFATSGSGTTVSSGATTWAFNTWNHFAVVRSSGSVTVYLNGVGGTATTCTQDFTNTTYVPTIGRHTHSADLYLTGYLSNLRVVKGTAVYTSDFTPPTSPLLAITNTSLLTCQSNRFVDNSANNFTITSNGTPKVTAWSPFQPSAAYSASTNGGSAYFDGSGDWLNTAQINLTGDFTIESYVYMTTGGAAGLFSTMSSSGTQGLALYLYVGYIQLKISNGSTVTNITATVTVPTNAWNHIAVTMSGTAVVFYLNGINVYSTTYSGARVSGYTTSIIGAWYADTGFSPITGYVSNLRVVNGTVIYTSNFTPPTAPLTAVSGTSLLLNCTNAAIYDNSGKNDFETVADAQISTSVVKYGTGSMYFDGTGDQLNAPGNAYMFNMGTGDFTVEAWAYHIPAFVSGTYRLIFQNYTSGVNTNKMAVGFNGDQFGLFFNSTGSLTSSGSGYFSQNTWMHLAVTKQNGTLKVWVNGIQRLSTTNSANFTAADNCIVGSGWYGYLDDVRVTKGVARYTANFVPPIQAFPDY